MSSLHSPSFHLPSPSLRILTRRALRCVVLPLAFTALAGAVHSAPEPRVALPFSHRPPSLAKARLVQRLDPAKKLKLSLVLPLRNRAELDAEISHFSDLKDPLYGHYLTPEQFAEKFGPAQVDVDAMKTFAAAHGLHVDDVSPNRTTVHVTGPVSAIESTFGVQINEYVDVNGDQFRAADREPTVDVTVAGRIIGILGMDTNQKPQPMFHHALVPFLKPLVPLLKPTAQVRAVTAQADQPQSVSQQPPSYFTGINGLSPADVKNIYGLANVPYTGTGQIVGLFEYGSFTASDITTFLQQYNIPPINVQPVSVDGYNTSTSPAYSGAAGEVTLDIDMIAALAPGVSQIRVYETSGINHQGNDESFTKLLVDAFTAMATEGSSTRPNVISVSYIVPESKASTADFNSLDQSLAQLAAQGQTVCVSSGDAGAYQDGTSPPNAGFPGSDPQVTCVGGTNLADTHDANNNAVYVSETSWADPNDTTDEGPLGSGGGGGISAHWPIPSWQAGAFNPSATKGSTTMRNLPDVSLYGDFNTFGYSVYLTGTGWYPANGTSASSPLWAAFLADVNQARLARGSSVIGFANPAIYQVAESPKYANDFHDIADGSTNLYYPAVTGYDNSTGWGSFQGANLLNDLGGFASTHVLWDKTDGTASIWNYSTTNGTFTQNTYGPISGQTAVAVADGPDNQTRVLWDTSGGGASIWSLNNISGQSKQFSFGPYSGWTATAISVGTDNTTHVLWDYPGGTASIWNYNAMAGTFTQNTYGPYSGWTAVAIADGSDGQLRVLWDKTDGTMSLWSLNNQSKVFTDYNFGPYPGWTAKSVSVGTDNTTHVLWDNTNGAASIWNYSTANGTFTQNTYGPYSGQTAVGLADGSNGKLRVLWDTSGGGASIWSLNNATASFNQFTFGPYAGWTAESISGN